MKHVKYFSFIILCMCVFPLYAHADCDYTRKAELNRLASNVQLSYGYVLNGENVPEFTVNLTNVVNDIYVVDNFGNTFYNDSAVKYTFGTNITYTFYSRSNDCSNEMLFTKYLNLPTFNSYFNDPLCKNSTSEYCELWTDTSELTYDDFEDNIQATTQEETKNKKSTSDSNDMFFQIFLISAVAIICLTMIIIYFKRFRK